MRTTIKEIKQYFNDNNLIPRHNIKGLKYAANEIAKEYKFNAFEVCLFMFENKDIKPNFLNSYNFNNSLGRQVKRDFEYYYFKYLDKSKNNFR